MQVKLGGEFYQWRVNAKGATLPSPIVGGSEEGMVRLEIAPQGRIRIRFQFESVRPSTDWRENDRLAS